MEMQRRNIKNAKAAESRARDQIKSEEKERELYLALKRKYE